MSLTLSNGNGMKKKVTSSSLNNTPTNLHTNGDDRRIHLTNDNCHQSYGGNVAPSSKRVIPVVPPEHHSGNCEYKRQLHHCTATRLEKLKTQMSFRLDEGNGCCLYRIGVEDDGCHSLLGYEACAETACLVEYLARSLNAVVLERKVIQQEIGTHPTTGEIVSLQRLSSLEEENDDDDEDVESSVVTVLEPSLLGNGRNEGGSAGFFDEEELDELDNRLLWNVNHGPTTLSKDEGVFTRMELTMQRIETHLLDPAPVTLSEMAYRGGNANSHHSSNGATTTTSRTMVIPNDVVKSSVNKPSKDKNSPTTTTTNGDHPSPSETTIATTPENDSQKLSVGETLGTRNIRVAVVGNVDAGKSTMIGTLTSSLLDDGRGSSRTSIMKHRHEIETGRTSTATTHLMGFHPSGEAISAKGDSVRANRRKSEDEVARESYRVITLMDLAGHEKYLKTTIHGVASGMADYSLILVNSRHPPTHMTHHHLNLCVSFGIHVIIVFTKVDGCPEHAFKTSKSEVYKLLRAPDVGKRPFEIRNEQDIELCLGKMQSLAPVFSTSCVSGDGLELLRKMLFALPKRRRHERKVERPFEFLVDDIFNVPGVGAVVSGFVNAGHLTVGSNAHVYVGPTDDGSFMKTVAKTAHIARINTTHVTSGQSACLALALSKDLRKKLRRGMVVLKESPTSTKEFDAEICVLKGEGTTIRNSYQAYVHILNVRQSAFARKIEIVNGSNVMASIPSSAHNNAQYGEDNEIVLRPGSRAKVRFEFAKRPEYVRPGMRMLFRDGRVRGVGLVTKIPTIVDPVGAK